MDLQAKTPYQEGQIAALSEIRKAYQELSREERWVQEGYVPLEAIRISLPALIDMGVTRPRAAFRGEEIPVVTDRDLQFIKGWDATLMKELGNTVE